MGIPPVETDTCNAQYTHTHTHTHIDIYLYPMETNTCNAQRSELGRPCIPLRLFFMQGGFGGRLDGDCASGVAASSEACTPWLHLCPGGVSAWLLEYPWKDMRTHAVRVHAQSYRWRVLPRCTHTGTHTHSTPRAHTHPHPPTHKQVVFVGNYLLDSLPFDICRWRGGRSGGGRGAGELERLSIARRDSRRQVNARGENEWTSRTGPGTSLHNTRKKKNAPGCLSPPKMAPCDGDSWAEGCRRNGAEGCRRNGAVEAMDGASGMQGRVREEAGQGWLRRAAFRWEPCDAAEVVGSSPAMRRYISVPLFLGGAIQKHLVFNSVSS